jgi:CheY-like chemotaxis protein
VAISRKGARDLATAKREIAISDKDRAQLLRRINYVADLMDGAGVLWVDDNPENNAYEMKLLRSLGIRIDVAESTSQALQFLGETKYDAVISDMARDGTPDAGLRFLTEIQDRGMTQRPIFYVGEHLASKGTPAGAFAITNRPDHLIHYLIDVLERERSD